MKNTRVLRVSITSCRQAFLKGFFALLERCKAVGKRRATVGSLLLALCALTGVIEPARAASPEMVDGYEILAGGETLRDPKTGLEWARCSLGQKWDGKTCAGDVSKFTFDGAQQEAKAFNGRGGLGGKADWRVPTVRELASLIYCSSGKTKYYQDPQDGKGDIHNWCDGGLYQPAIRLEAFPGSSKERYWSSSLYLPFTGDAWIVDFDSGYLTNGLRNLNYSVRMVRTSDLTVGAAALAVYVAGLKPPRSGDDQITNLPPAPGLEAVFVGVWISPSGEVSKAAGINFESGGVVQSFYIALRGTSKGKWKVKSETELQIVLVGEDGSESPPISGTYDAKTKALSICPPRGAPFSSGCFVVEKQSNRTDSNAAQNTSPVAPSSGNVDGYEILAGGEVVSDPKTGLEWIRCSLGQKWNGKTCEGKAREFKFEDAQNEGAAFNQRGGLAGKSDWRLPTVRELSSLIYCSSGKSKESDVPKDGHGPIANLCDGDYKSPTIRRGVFPNTPGDRFWSSSVITGWTNTAWGVQFINGDVYWGNFANAVRLVRSSNQWDGKDDLGSTAKHRKVAALSPGASEAQANGAPSLQPAANAQSDVEVALQPSARLPAAAATADSQPDLPPKSRPRSRLAACAGLSNGDAVRISVAGQPQPQSALVLEVSGAQVSVRVMGSSAAAGRKLNVACSKVRKAK